MSNNNENKNKNIILNDKEKKLLLDHNYDGIEEFDYPLPAWWTWIFVGTCIFGVFYLYFYHFADGPSLQAEFKIENAKIELLREEAQKKMSSFNEKDFSTWVTANDGVNKGREVFMDNCVACHTENGGGDIGPNLTDSYWIHLKKVTHENIFTIVKNGVIDKGMPVWSEVLSKEEIYAVVAFVKKEIVGTNVAGGKEPQGEKVEN